MKAGTPIAGRRQRAVNGRGSLAGWGVSVALLALLALLALARTDRTVLYEKASAYNTVVVTQEDGLRVLRFERHGARQSVVKLGKPEHLELPYTRLALVGLALSEESRRFLVVGLGGGSLPMFLRKHYPEATIESAEIDPEVVDVAKKFFGFREDLRMIAHVADGRQFIETSRQPYDVIFLDAFGSDSIPVHLTTEEFLRAVRRAVKPGGVVVSNLWDRRLNPLYDSMVRTYQEVFEEVLVLSVRSRANMILLALPREQPLRREELVELAGKVSAARRFPFDLGEPARYGFQKVPAKSRHVRVLRDRDLAQAEPRDRALHPTAAFRLRRGASPSLQERSALSAQG